MNIAIIGAGAAGLSAAYDLVGLGHQVTIYEAAPHTGGLAAGFKEPHWDWTMEKFYHHWFQSDKDVLGLIDEIGARDKVLFPRPITAIYYQGQFHPFDSMFTNMPLFLLRHFNLLDVARFGSGGRVSQVQQQLESAGASHGGSSGSIGAWAQRVYESMWKPLLVGKFSEEHYRDVNMAWFWARLHSRTTRLGTFVGGFQAFFDTLAEAVQQRGATLHLSTAVREIAPQRIRRRHAAHAAGRDRLRRRAVDHLAAFDDAPHARAAARLSRAAQRPQIDGRGGDGHVAHAAAQCERLLLAQPAQGRGLPLPGDVRAHQLRLARTLRRRSFDLLRRLSVHRSRILPASRRTSCSIGLRRPCRASIPTSIDRGSRRSGCSAKPTRSPSRRSITRRTFRTFARRSKACTSRRCRKSIRGIAARITRSRLAAARPG